MWTGLVGVVYDQLSAGTGKLIAESTENHHTVAMILWNVNMSAS
jgi:hypothetical protein